MKKFLIAMLVMSIAAPSFAKTSWGKIIGGAALVGGAVYVANKMSQPKQPQPQPAQEPAGQPQQSQLPTPPSGYGYVQKVDPSCNCVTWQLQKLPN